jgi:hypothetical protein
MTQIGQNNGRQGALPMSSHPHDEFVRLAALDTTGELSPDERDLLEEHLSHCEDCRQARLSYDRVVREVLPPLAAEMHADSHDENVTEFWSKDDAERRLMTAIDQEPVPTEKSRIPRLSPTQKKLIGFLAIVMAGGTVAGLRAYHRPTDQPTQSNTPASHSAQTSASGTAPSAEPSRHEMLPEPEAQARMIDSLRRDLQLAQAHSSELETQLTTVAAELEDRNRDLADGSAEHTKLAQRLSDQQVTATSLQEQLTAAQGEVARGGTRLVALQNDVASLNAVVDSKDRTIADDQQLLLHDRDIRNLMGAPDLYIADIRDVGEDGKARKPFGRVFYTRDKSLIFYGFDLDRQPGIKETTVFQAWGSRDAEHDINLGVFYRDESNQRRWILKFNDPQTLARLDSVFVTAEPRGGSTKPSGKPLLSAYLRLPPNHP